MRIRDIFATKIEEKIEPVIKVAERQDEHKLAGEIGSYTVTPTIEKYLDDFIEHYTDTFRTPTTEIGVWISGYLGSGKSHLAKIAALLIENRTLEGIPAIKRFEPRVPADAPRRESLLRSLSRIPQCDSQVLAFNLNSLADSKTTPLARLLLSQFYLSKGYGSNFLYARVIEAELDKRGKLQELHAAAERAAKKPWADIQKNISVYAKPLYQAASEVAPELFPTPEDAATALKQAEKGELYNIQFLVATILDDLQASEKVVGKPCRLALVLDESGQWIEDSGERLSQLQALVEEAAVKGQGKVWIFVTTHEDMASIYSSAMKLEAHGDFKKIESRFRYKWNLTTENIELVLEDRLFKKTVDGKGAVESVYNENPGVLGDIGRLANTSQKLPECSEQRFVTFYPFFPYQIHLIPEIVKSLRSSGGRGEQLSGSTRTLLAITQDIVRAGRRNYLDAAVGEMVSFDEVYGNLAGEAEVSPDVRRELSRIEEVVPSANALTRRVAEVLYIIRELAYIPRTIDNLARLLVEHTSDDLTTIIGRIKPELDKLISAKLVAKLGEEFEFLTGERRTFEEEVAGEAVDTRWADLQKELADEFEVIDVLGFQTVPFKNAEFRVRIFFDETQVTKEGDIDVRFYSPLATLGGKKVSDLENESLHPEEQQTIFVLCDRIPGFDEQLKYYRAMRLVIDRWKGDAQKSEEAHKLAAERELHDLEKVSGKVLDGMRDGLRRAQIVFRGSARTVSPKSGVTPGEAIRNELASFWPTLYPKFEKVPVRIMNEQRAIPDVLRGEKNLAADVKQLRMFDAAGALDPQCPLLDHIRVYLSTRQSKKERTMGRDLIDEFVKPPYGWDPSALRVGVAALVRSGAIRVLINKKPYTNPADPELQDALRVSRTFDKVELVLEETEVNPDVLTEVRSLLIRLTVKRKIDETPAALSTEMETFGKELLGQSANTVLWAEPAGLPLPKEFGVGCEVLEKIVALTNPVHRVTEIHVQKDRLEGYAAAIRATTAFVDKWGKAFTEMREFAARLTALEHRLPASGDCSRFMGNWRTATANASVASDGIWRELQDSHGAADLELKKAVSEWREDARKRTQDALGRLPEDLAAAGLPAAEVQETLAVPLNGFLASLDNETDAVRVAALPERASRLVCELGDAIRAEVERRAKKDGGDKDKPPPKRITRIRVADVATTVRIQNEAQWNLVRDRLDQTVKRELANGNDVEIG